MVTCATLTRKSEVHLNIICRDVAKGFILRPTETNGELIDIDLT